MKMVREATCKLLAWAEEGILSWQSLAEMALGYMSEDDVKDMVRANDLLDDEEAF
jgi:hypothetical protein